MQSSKKKIGSARFSVSYELLVDMLHLPPDTEIVEVTRGRSYGRPPDTFDVYVHHPDLPEVLPEGDWSEATPVFKTQDPVIFVEWGIDEK